MVPGWCHRQNQIHRCLYDWTLVLVMLIQCDRSCVTLMADKDILQIVICKSWQLHIKGIKRDCAFMAMTSGKTLIAKDIINNSAAMLCFIFCNKCTTPILPCARCQLTPNYVKMTSNIFLKLKQLWRQYGPSWSPGRGYCFNFISVPHIFMILWSPPPPNCHKFRPAKC